MKKSLILLLSLFYLTPSFALLTTPSLTSPSIGSLNNNPNEILDWSAVSSATGYEYKLSTDPGLSGASIITITGSSQAGTSNLLFGAVYYWQVRAIKTSAPIDSSAWSAIWNFTTIDQLGLVSPVSGSLNIAPNETLDWSGITGITNYDYEWDTVATFNSPLYYYASTGTTSQVNTANLRFGTTYYWRIRARHAADTSLWSAIWNFTTIDQLGLVSPVSGSLNIAPNETLDWSGITGISNYDYEWDTVATFNSPLYFYASTGTTSLVNAANLRFGTTYYWRIRARHAADTSQWSAIWNFTTIDQLGLVSPLNGSLNIAPNETLDWSGITGISNYDYEWDTVATFNSPLYYYASTGTTSQVNTANLRFGTTYYWRIRARHAADTSQWSAIWNFTTIDQLGLVSPLSGSLNIAPNETLDWSGITGISNYDYEWDTVTTFNSPLYFYASTGTTSQVNTANLRFGTTYYWRIRARHAADTSQWSAIWNFTTIEYLSLLTPANNSVSINLNPLIDWSGISGINGYQYRYSTSINFSNPSLFTTGTTSQANLSNLSYGTQYFWQVRTFHAADTSEWSLPWSFITIYQITTAPSLISPADGTANIAVTGTPLQWSSVNGATLYEYQYDDDVNFSSPVINTTVALNDLTGSLTAGTTYYWRVRAGNGSGFSPWSVTWSFTTESISGISNQSANENFAVYPNPTTGIINIKTSYRINAITIYNSAGLRVFMSEMKNFNSTVDLSGYPKGVYLVELSNEEKIFHHQFIIR